MYYNKYASTGQHFFINNCMGSFYRGILDWFGDEFYDRVKYKVIGTYEKSVEFFNKKCETGHEIDTNILPSLTLDPSYDFQPEERGGRFLWQSQWQAAGLGEKLFDSYTVGLDDQSIRLVPVFSRYQGSFELIFWLNSVYELLDVRTYLFQFSGGLGRIMRPKMFESFIILPDAILDLEDGNSVPVDWSQSELTIKKITNMNSDLYVMPIKLNPWFKFSSINDASQKYGGDSVAEYKLSVTVDYEIEIPTYMVITPHAKLEFVNMKISMDSTYSRYGKNPTFNSVTQMYEKQTDESGERKDVEDTNILNTNGNRPSEIVDVIERAYYKFTEADESDDSEWFAISNPFAPDIDQKYINVITYTGQLDYGDYWKFNTDKSNIEVKITPKENELVEFFRYQ